MSVVIFIASCSTPKIITPKVENLSKDEMRTNRDNCIMNSVAIDCAKYAYHIKPTNPQAAKDFYKKTCELGEKNSCYNLGSEEDASLEANQNLISSKRNVLYACFKDYLMKIEPKGFFSMPTPKAEETNQRTMHIKVKLEPSGKIRTVEVPGYESRLEGVKCMERTIGTLHFLPNKRAQNLEYSFNVDIVPYK
jgi:hypothetical protein